MAIVGRRFLSWNMNFTVRRNTPLSKLSKITLSFRGFRSFFDAGKTFFFSRVIVFRLTPVITLVRSTGHDRGIRAVFFFASDSKKLSSDVLCLTSKCVCKFMYITHISLNFGQFTLIQRQKPNICVRKCICLQLLINQIVNDNFFYKLLCMKVRLQAGFEPSTLSVKKKFSCTLPTSHPLRCLCRWQTVRIIMLNW